MKAQLQAATRVLSKVGFAVQKHSPLLLTITGVVGLAATAVLAYKAAPKVDAIIKDVEEKRANEARYSELQEVPAMRLTSEEVIEKNELEANPETMYVDRKKVALDVAGAVAAPVLAGVGSICAVTLSYYILTHRVGSLAAAVSSLIAERKISEKHMREALGDTKYEEIIKHNLGKTDEDAWIDNETGEVMEKPKDAPTVKKQNLTGIWFVPGVSDEAVSDDHAYNTQFVTSVRERLESKIGYRGYLHLNEVLDALGCARLPEGAMMGWTTSDSFNVAIDVIGKQDVDGNYVPNLYIKWPMPRYIYEDVDYDGHYAFI